MAFEVFTGAGARKQEFISITESKTFGLSRGFLDSYKITKNHRAVILYDGSSKQIGLYFGDDNPKFGLTVRIPNPDHGASILAYKFFDQKKEVDPEVYAGRYSDFSKKPLKDLGINKEGYAFVFTLKERNVEKKKSKEENIQEVDNNNLPININDIPF